MKFDPRIFAWGNQTIEVILQHILLHAKYFLSKQHYGDTCNCVHFFPYLPSRQVGFILLLAGIRTPSEAWIVSNKNFLPNFTLSCPIRNCKAPWIKVRMNRLNIDSSCLRTCSLFLKVMIKKINFKEQNGDCVTQIEVNLLILFQ